MPENDQANSDAKKAQSDHNRAPDAGLRWIVGAGILGLLILFFVSVYLPNLTERAKFFTGNALSLLVLGVITVQAYIYRKQWEVMQWQIDNAKVSERAYIGVKRVITENQALGKLPNVRVTLSNGGRTPAWKLKCPATLTLGTEFPNERPETSTAESPTFLAAGAETTFNYPFPFVLTPQWLAHIQVKGWTAYLHMEAHFEDCWGEQQVMTFKLAYRPGDDRWGDYKERQEVIGTWHYS